MKGATLLWGYFCVTFAFWMITQSRFIITFREFEFNPSDVSSWFSILQFDIGTAIGLTIGGIAGLLSYLFKVGIYANGVILIWILALIFKPTNQLMLGLPIFLNSLLAPIGLSWLAQVPQAFFAFSLFLWLAEIMSQQKIQT